MEEQQNLYAQYVENVYQNLTELGGGRLGKTFLARYMIDSPLFSI